MSTSQKKIEGSFCLHLQYNERQDATSVFASIAQFLEGFRKLDEAVLGSIDKQIAPLTVIQDIEAGSIKIWLANLLRKAEDKDLENFEIKKSARKIACEGQAQTNQLVG